MRGFHGQLLSLLGPNQGPRKPGGSSTPASTPIGARLLLLEASSDRVGMCLHAAIYVAAVDLVLLT